MRIRHLTDDHQRDLSVTVTGADATVADLAQALKPQRRITPLLVNGRLVPAATPLDRAGIDEGATIQAPNGDEASAHAPGATVARSVIVTTGLDAGRRFDLRAGDHIVGRRNAGGSVEPGVAIADPTVSARHARLRITSEGTATVTDLDSRNGTWVGQDPAHADHPIVAGGTWRCGSAELTFIEVPAQPSAPPPPAHGGTRPLHRRPRPRTPPEPRALTPPPPPDPPAAVTPVGLIAVVASVGFGAVMVVVLGSWAYAVFALLGPMVMVANALDARRRRRSGRRRTARGRRVALSELAATVDERRAQEIRRRDHCFIGPAQAALIADDAGPHCWERRLGDADAARVRIAVGPDTWYPPVEGTPQHWADDVRLIVDTRGRLDHAVIGLCLTPGMAVAIVGPAEPARCLARSILIQAATIHGPADLHVAALAAGAPAAWDWAAWLPHSRTPEHGSLLAGNDLAGDRLAASLLRHPAEPNSDDRAERAITLVAIDDRAGLRARRSTARRVLSAATAPACALVPIVIVDDPADVPASCTVTLEIDATGALRRPNGPAQGEAVAVGTALDVAADLARSLAALDDPEVPDGGRGLPDAVALAHLTGPGRLDRRAVMAHWRSAGPDPAPIATLGATSDGLLQIDLAVDGPHVLVAGTTGAGKSELLRTLVSSLAVTSSPDHLSFVLIDFKGGSAFDACAHLPHTVGVVTDLDAGLAARALRCLEAELRHRERRLRSVGADDLIGFRRASEATDPLPRLVVVIDEFATLAAELPDFVDALVGVAQRGRSLGVHLVLATQRPAGSVSEQIKANTGLRIALRVESNEDSIDVIGTPAAASLPRRHPGRALARFGPGDLVATQTARVTGAALGGRANETGHLSTLWVAPLGVERPEVGERAEAADALGRTDLDQIAERLSDAWTEIGGRAPRRPWPDPLPGTLRWPMADHGPGLRPDDVCIGLADHPDDQRQTPWHWSAGSGALAVVGAAGAGTTTTLATIALELARRHSPRECHLHVIDLGTGDLGALVGLPHVGAVIGADDVERQRRLVADLSKELARRRSSGRDEQHQRRVLIIDGLATLAARCDGIHGDPTWDRLCELIARGPDVAIAVCFSVGSTAGPAHRVVSTCRNRLVMALNDPADAALYGIAAADLAAMVPGRAIASQGATVVQIAQAPDGLAAAVARLAGALGPMAPGGAQGPRRVRVLPDDLELSEVAQDPGHAGDDPSLVVGMADAGLVPARLVLRPGGHALVAGPPGSGRTTLLATLATSALAIGLEVVVIGDGAGPWPKEATAYRVDDPALAERLDQARPLLVVVDDADCTDDDHPLLGELVRDRRAHRHVVAAARNDRIRSGYGHWLREVRADRCGIVLQPDLDLDGELVGARLPHVAPLRLGVGRGWLAGGEPEGWIQVARRPGTPQEVH